MVAPAKAPPSLLAEAKKDCGHWAAIVSCAPSDAQRQKREGGASWQESGLIWPDGLVGGRAEPGTPGHTVSPYSSYGG
jgi:hypothetical protein